LTVLAAESDVGWFEDTNWTAHGCRFYRSVTLPQAAWNRLSHPSRDQKIQLLHEVV
jgi:hypothetical protein